MISKETKDLMKKIDEYQLNNIIGTEKIFADAIAQNLINGSVRRMFLSSLLREKYMLCPNAFKYFISKTQAMPMIMRLKNNDIMIEREGYFLLNPDWLQAQTKTTEFFKKRVDDD